jgi:hypothetical protein
MQGFSFASLILSYFLVGGGMFAGSVAAVALQVHTELMAYLLLAGGAFVGGFIAARASRCSRTRARARRAARPGPSAGARGS